MSPFFKSVFLNLNVLSLLSLLCEGLLDRFLDNHQMALLLPQKLKVPHAYLRETKLFLLSL